MDYLPNKEKTKFTSFILCIQLVDLVKKYFIHTFLCIIRMVLLPICCCVNILELINLIDIQHFGKTSE